MIGVFCVDIGYSLKRESKKWEQNVRSYPGQALYGVNHFREFEIEPIFECCEHDYFYGKWYAFIDEFIKLASIIKSYKKIDLIYFPHAYYSRWIVFLKRFNILKKPIVACLHNKNNLFGFIKSCDYVFTINPTLCKKLKEQYPDACIEYIPLLPESRIKLQDKGVYRYDVISIGNTKRDYQTLIEAMRGLEYRCLIVTDLKMQNIPENVTIIHEHVAYENCLELYASSRIIAIPIQENAEEGVFGLTSLIDAISVERPIIVTKTKGLGIPIADEGLGLEVEIGNSQQMQNAILQLLRDKEEWDRCRDSLRKYRLDHNMESSTKKMCQIFREIVKK